MLSRKQLLTAPLLIAWLLALYSPKTKANPYAACLFILGIPQSISKVSDNQLLLNPIRNAIREKRLSAQWSPILRMARNHLESNQSHRFSNDEIEFALKRLYERRIEATLTFPNDSILKLWLTSIAENGASAGPWAPLTTRANSISERPVFDGPLCQLPQSIYRILWKPDHVDTLQSLCEGKTSTEIAQAQSISELQAAQFWYDSIYKLQNSTFINGDQPRFGRVLYTRSQMQEKLDWFLEHEQSRLRLATPRPRYYEAKLQHIADIQEALTYKYLKEWPRKRSKKAMGGKKAYDIAILKAPEKFGPYTHLHNFDLDRLRVIPDPNELLSTGNSELDISKMKTAGLLPQSWFWKTHRSIKSTKVKWNILDLLLQGASPNELGALEDRPSHRGILHYTGVFKQALLERYGYDEVPFHRLVVVPDGAIPYFDPDSTF